MATAILAPGTTAATSIDILLAANVTETVALYADGALPDVRCTILMDTPSATDTPVGALTDEEPVATLTGPGTFRVSRPACLTAVGVCTGT